MEPMSLPPGYLLPEGKTMRDILRMDAELLASEGIDPQWPGFEDPPQECRVRLEYGGVVVESRGRVSRSGRGHSGG